MPPGTGLQIIPTPDPAGFPSRTLWGGQASATDRLGVSVVGLGLVTVGEQTTSPAPGDVVVGKTLITVGEQAFTQSL